MLNKFCWILPLSWGMIILGSLGLIEVIFLLAPGIHGLFELMQFATMPTWPNILMAHICLLAYIFLLFGAWKSNCTAMFIFMCIDGLLVLLALLRIILETVTMDSIVPIFFNDCAELYRTYKNFDCQKIRMQTIGINAGILGLCTILNVYSWICGYSFYKEIKKGKENRETKGKKNGSTP